MTLFVPLSKYHASKQERNILNIEDVKTKYFRICIPDKEMKLREY